MPAYPTFSTRVIGQAEKTLNAILGRELAGTGLTEPQWVILTLAVTGGGAADRDRFTSMVADALKISETEAKARVAEARKAEGLGGEIERLQGDATAAQSALDGIAAELARARADTADAQRERDEARQALSALQRERRDPEPQVTSTAQDIDAARKQALDLRTQLEQAREDSAQLEHALIEKDNALAGWKPAPSSSNASARSKTRVRRTSRAKATSRRRPNLRSARMSRETPRIHRRRIHRRWFASRATGRDRSRSQRTRSLSGVARTATSKYSPTS